jgi:hypothetical protein
VSFLLANLLIQLQLNLTSPFAQLHESAVAHNRRQPSGHLRLSPKLVYMLVGRQQGFLHRILCVSRIPQQSEGTTIERRQAE